MGFQVTKCKGEAGGLNRGGSTELWDDSGEEVNLRNSTPHLYLGSIFIGSIQRQTNFFSYCLCPVKCGFSEQTSSERIQLREACQELHLVLAPANFSPWGHNPGARERQGSDQ